MPRPKDDVWEHYESANVGKPHKAATCKHCKKPMVGIPQRLVKHLISCRGAPNGMNEEYAEIYEMNYGSTSKRKRSATPDSTSKKVSKKRAPASPNTPRTPQPAKIPLNVQREFQYDMASMIYSMGASFRQIENPKLRQNVAKYLPGYKLPSRQSVAGPLLEKAYENEREDVIKVINEEEYVTIVTDGYADINNEHIMNYMVVAPGIRPLFWGSVRTGKDRQTGDFIGRNLLQIIKDVEKDCPSAKVVGLVTDNAANMKKAWKRVQKKRKNIIAIGCAAHSLNLVLQKIFKIKECEKVCNDGVALSKFIRNRSVLLARFREDQLLHFPQQKGRLELVLPVETRWYSAQRCLRSVLQNRAVIESVFADVEFMSTFQGQKLVTAQSIVTSTTFWADVERILVVTAPISKSMALLEHDNCSLSKIYHEFNQLLKDPVFREDSPTSTTLRSQVRDVIEARWKKYRQPVMGVAFLLDPTVPFSFEGDEAQAAVQTALSMAKDLGVRGVSMDDFRNELFSFIKKKKKWRKQQLDENRGHGVANYWRIAGFDTVERFAHRILSIPSSSAACERSWSIHNFIQSKRRNRLKAEKLEKLAFLYSNMGSKAPVKPASERNERQAGGSDLRVSIEGSTPNASSRSGRGLGEDAATTSESDEDEERPVTTTDFIFAELREHGEHCEPVIRVIRGNDSDSDGDSDGDIDISDSSSIDSSGDCDSDTFEHFSPDHETFTSPPPRPPAQDRRGRNKSTSAASGGGRQRPQSFSSMPVGQPPSARRQIAFPSPPMRYAPISSQVGFQQDPQAQITYSLPIRSATPTPSALRQQRDVDAINSSTLPIRSATPTPSALRQQRDVDAISSSTLPIRSATPTPSAQGPRQASSLFYYPMHGADTG